ncbi:MAG TPA: potassium-transporting ATPase subunit C [Thermoplasmata archaeon]|nr:potassium-transporting ATPase subunit C [Thermoplasmata archaeon]
MSAPSSSRVPPPRAHSLGGHLRAAGIFLVVTLLLAGFAYPLLVTGIAQLIDPGAANGSLLYYSNGTLAGSSLIAQNTDAPYLFWSRPSLTDYNLTLGAESPPGPSDPQLQALFNETIAYMQKYGIMTVNATVPFWYAAPSASSIDPDLVPEAVLVQIPRVANATNLSIADLQGFVNSHIVNPAVPYLGVPFVNVLELDLALLPLIGR